MHAMPAWQQGAPNPEAGGRQRPVAYVLISVPGGGRDTYNFPEASVWDDVTPETIADFPLFRESQKSGVSHPRSFPCPSSAAFPSPALS